MTGNINQAGIFLVNILFYLYILTFMLRFLLQLVRADYYNPVSQALVKITNPVLKPLRRVIPGYRGIDIAALLVMFLLEVLRIYVAGGLLGGMELRPGFVVLFSLRALFLMVLNVYFWTILIEVVMSWVNPGSYNPVISVLYSLNEPLLGRARKILPSMGGLDLSPILVLIVLEVLQILIT